MESGGYFLFVLGERANSGTLWSSVPVVRKGGKEPGGVGQGGDKEGREKQRVRPSTAGLLKLFRQDLYCSDGHQRAAQLNCGNGQTSTALTDC